MLKTIIDTQKTIGKVQEVIDVRPWYDFQDGEYTEKVLGARVTCIVIENKHLNKFEKITVKVNKTVEELDLEEGDRVSFVNLVGSTYVNGKYVAVSFKADDVQTEEFVLGKK